MSFERVRRLRTHEIAALLGLGPRRVQQLIASGEFGKVDRTPGGFALVSLDAVETFRRRLENATPAKSAQTAKSAHAFV